ncbi:hypothetical protein DL98DRAFT_533408 [Cadophora sp. DSE1049]|nr:hypothetical protein DL98DRAFT_533408 [Cadophora sp. DSE1049]
MPEVATTLEYLKDLELYHSEKPYFCLMPAANATQADNEQMDNLEFESHHDIRINDIRPLKEHFKLDEYGFEVVSHTSRFLDLQSDNGLNSIMDLAEYQLETEDMLTGHLGATFVKCYDIVMRRNIIFDETVFDLRDQMHVIGPARGAHNDITYNSGPTIINRYLSEDEKQRTWRSILPVLEDRPLALCDSRTVAPSDLIACDRIIPDRVGEVYYLKYNSQHKWYWLSRQTCFEPLVFVLYDTKGGNHARFCPHVSFPNPEAPRNAPPRRSVETRSIVITQQ